MSFDLRAYAAEHRYRVRNLHDGAPVPPARVQRTGGPVRRPSDHRSVAYRGEADRQDAIICRDGYVDFGGYGPDRIGFCVLCRSQRGLHARLRLLAETGATVTQEGDTEAAGYAPLARIAEVLAALRPYRHQPASAAERLRPYRRQEARPGARVPRLQSTQTPVVGGWDRPLRIRVTFATWGWCRRHWRPAVIRPQRRLQKVPRSHLPSHYARQTADEADALARACARLRALVKDNLHIS